MRACRLCSIVASLLLVQTAMAGYLDQYVDGKRLSDQTLPELRETLRGAVERYVKQTKEARAVAGMGGWQYARTYGTISRRSGHIRHLLDYLAHLDRTIEGARTLQAQNAGTTMLAFDLDDVYKEAAAEHVRLR